MASTVLFFLRSFALLASGQSAIYLADAATVSEALRQGRDRSGGIRSGRHLLRIPRH